MKLIILGSPGTGKGTAAHLLSKKLKLKHICTGDLFRKEYTKKTKIGLHAYSYWGKGNLVPSKITIFLTHSVLPSKNYILDGYPRNLTQAKALEKKQPTDYVLYLKTPSAIVVKRLLHRAKIEGRKDDTLPVIKNRLHVYHKETQPLLTFYKKKLILINGNQSIDKVLKDLLLALQTT